MIKELTVVTAWQKALMHNNSSIPEVAIVDYGIGNLFSVKHACTQVGLKSEITSSKEKILESDAVILPGVGAFGDAMETLAKLDLIDTLKEAALSGKPFLGICLGMQLIMSESHEFGRHEGLGIFKGSVVRFDNPVDDKGRKLKVPHVGWNRIYKSRHPDTWKDTVLNELDDKDFMYFVHSFYVKPDNPDVVLSRSQYGNVEFCSSLNYKNIYACQFHPERSGSKGLQIYRNLLKIILDKRDAR